MRQILSQGNLGSGGLPVASAAVDVLSFAPPIVEAVLMMSLNTDTALHLVDLRWMRLFRYLMPYTWWGTLFLYTYAVYFMPYTWWGTLCGGSVVLSVAL